MDGFHTSRSQCAGCLARLTVDRLTLDRSPELLCTPRLFLPSFPVSYKADRSGLFSAFTVAMFSTHLVLIGTNQTKVERLAAHDMKDREDATLDEMFSCCPSRFVPFLSPAPPPPLASFVRIELYWVAFSGNSGVRDGRGMQSMDV